MEIVDAFLGLGATTLLVGAAILGLVGWKFFNLGLGKNTLTIVKVAALIFAVGGLVAGGWLATDAGTGEVSPEAPVEWDASAAIETAPATIAIGANHYKNNVEYNTTSGAFNNNTGYCQLNFSVSRLDENPDWAATNAEVTTVGSYTSTTTGITYSVISKDANGEYNAIWTKSSGTTDRMQTSVPRNTDYRDDYVVLNITASPACFSAMTLYRSCSTIISIGGETFTVDWEYAVTGT